jgi:tRNA(Ile)-lysidine synthase
MLTLAPEFGLVDRVCHINHGLRGAESDRTRPFVVELCAALGSRPVFKTDAAAAAKARGNASRGLRRDIRYDFSLKPRRKPALCISPPPTTPGQSGNRIFNLARGCGAAGAAGIPPKRDAGGVAVVRPLFILGAGAHRGVS